MTSTMTVQELAEELGIDERAVRVFLRDVTPPKDHPGFGKRWEVKGTSAALKKLKNRYEIWSEDHKRLLEHHRVA